MSTYTLSTTKPSGSHIPLPFTAPSERTQSFSRPRPPRGIQWPPPSKNESKNVAAFNQSKPKKKMRALYSSAISGNEHSGRSSDRAHGYSGAKKVTSKKSVSTSVSASKKSKTTPRVKKKSRVSKRTAGAETAKSSKKVVVKKKKGATRSSVESSTIVSSDAKRTSARHDKSETNLDVKVTEKTSPTTEGKTSSDAKRTSARHDKAETNLDVKVSKKTSPTTEGKTSSDAKRTSARHDKAETNLDVKVSKKTSPTTGGKTSSDAKRTSARHDKAETNLDVKVTEKTSPTTEGKTSSDAKRTSARHDKAETNPDVKGIEKNSPTGGRTSDTKTLPESQISIPARPPPVPDIETKDKSSNAVDPKPEEIKSKSPNVELEVQDEEEFSSALKSKPIEDDSDKLGTKRKSSEKHVDFSVFHEDGEEDHQKRAEKKKNMPSSKSFVVTKQREKRRIGITARSGSFSEAADGGQGMSYSPITVTGGNLYDFDDMVAIDRYPPPPPPHTCDYDLWLFAFSLNDVFSSHLPTRIAPPEYSSVYLTKVSENKQELIYTLCPPVDGFEPSPPPVQAPPLPNTTGGTISTESSDGVTKAETNEKKAKEGEKKKKSAPTAPPPMSKTAVHKAKKSPATNPSKEAPKDEESGISGKIPPLPTMESPTSDPSSEIDKKKQDKSQKHEIQKTEPPKEVKHAAKPKKAVVKKSKKGEKRSSKGVGSGKKRPAVRKSTIKETSPKSKLQMRRSRSGSIAGGVLIARKTYRKSSIQRESTARITPTTSTRVWNQEVVVSRKMRIEAMREKLDAQIANGKIPFGSVSYTRKRQQEKKVPISGVQGNQGRIGLVGISKEPKKVVRKVKKKKKQVKVSTSKKEEDTKSNIVYSTERPEKVSLFCVAPDLTDHPSPSQILVERPRPNRRPPSKKKSRRIPDRG